MDADLGHLEILEEMMEQAKFERDLSAETICLSLALLVADPEIRMSDEYLRTFIKIGAALWRHSARFSVEGEGQTRQ